MAQEDDTLEDMLAEGLLRGLDNTLFHLYRPEEDPYTKATKYYRPQVAQRRRGLDWWLSEDIVEPLQRVELSGERDEVGDRVRMVASTKDYNFALSGNYSHISSKGWRSYASVDVRTGRDMNIEGVYQQNMRGNIGVSRQFGTDHLLNIDLEVPILNRALRGDASQEAITLTGDNLYNPSWGLYDGEVRSANVSKYAIPELCVGYQRPLSSVTKLIARADAEYGRRGVSRLGWYDGYNPTPDYYRKMPSYFEQGDVRDEVEQLWRAGDVEYTQIGWDRLVAQNCLSEDGESHYVMEERVERRLRSDMQLLLTSDVGDGVELIYGARGDLSSSRYFKEMVDLLGGEYLLDHDLYIGDDVHLGIDMQNDLRNPDRKVVEGDRFGYDYTLRSRDIGAVLGAEYRHDYLNIALRGEFGGRRVQRVGHYEKERFAGSLSYGESVAVTMPSNRVDLRVGYSPSGRHHITFEALYHQLPIYSDDLFIQTESANRVIDSPTSREVVSTSLGYRYERENFTLDVEGYLLYSRGETQVWSYYDDLSYTYSNVVVSDMGMQAVGLDVVSRWRVSRKVEWSVAMALGDYTYDTTPIVTLYDDHDMTLLSSSPATAFKECKVGSAPQVLITSSLDYFIDYGMILSADCSYGGGRYVAPSVVRRTDRVVYALSSPEMVSEVVEQEQLAGVFDLTVSLYKSYKLRNGRRLAFNARVNNLLGDAARVEYGRESNRILTTSGGSDVGSRYIDGNSYVYGVPRTYYLSCGYNF